MNFPTSPVIYLNVNSIFTSSHSGNAGQILEDMKNLIPPTMVVGEKEIFSF